MGKPFQPKRWITQGTPKGKRKIPNTVAFVHWRRMWSAYAYTFWHRKHLFAIGQTPQVDFHAKKQRNTFGVHHSSKCFFEGKKMSPCSNALYIDLTESTQILILHWTISSNSSITFSTSSPLRKDKGLSTCSNSRIISKSSESRDSNIPYLALCLTVTSPPIPRIFGTSTLRK